MSSESFSGMGGPTQAAGTAVSAISSYYDAKVRRTMLKSSARIADMNAQMTEFAANEAENTGQFQERALRLQGAQLKSRQRAAMGASGFDLGDESSLNILTSTDYFTEVDANTIRANAVKEAWGLRLQAVNQRNEARGARTEASQINPFMRAGTTLLTGAARVARSQQQLANARDGTQYGGLPWQAPGNVRPKWYGGGTY